MSFLQTPYVPENCRHVFHQYTIRISSSERKKFIEYLSDSGIESGIYYNTVLYKQSFCRRFGYKDGLCREAEKATDEVLYSKLEFVVDVDEKRAKKVAKVNKTDHLTDFGGLLGKIDAAVIAVPTGYHYLVAKPLLQNGIHCLVEKPFTLSVEEAEELIETAKTGNLVLQG
ncbi:hypothetical protein AGMMS49953_06370 [Endomicrobiia bacterium]|nr:Gfo/Idh/MocA family oxidoreductase [Candidatus Endomicrobium trichonymphae]GHT24257.1 hypothetical protein AGMMS49953_06370 [Endomicrobiia bacterium]